MAELEEAEFWLPSGFLADDSRSQDEGSSSADWGDGSDLGSLAGDEITDEEESQSLASRSVNFPRSFLNDRELFPPLSASRSKEVPTVGSPNSTLRGAWRRGNSSLEKQGGENPWEMRSKQPHNQMKPKNRDSGSCGMRAMFLYNQPKRENAGTGVFLPRTKGTAGESRKKPACSTVMLPERVVRALNLDLNEIAASSRLHSVFVIGSDGTPKGVSRIWGPQEAPAKNELQSDVRLPPDWTY